MVNTCQCPWGVASPIRVPRGGPSAQSGHLGRHSALVQENRLLWRDRAEGFAERLPPLPVRFRVALLCVE